MPALIRVTDLSVVQPLPASLHGCAIDMPREGGLVDISGQKIAVAAWALGKDSTTIGFEFRDGDGLSRQIPINRARPDVAAAFPGVPGAANSGFHAFFPVAVSTVELDLDISVILADHRVIRFATMHGERTWRGADQPASDSLVSVVIAVDGHADLLPDAIDCVMAQTHPHLEVVVVSDHESFDKATEVADGYPGVRSVRQENPGLAEARNMGIRHTLGDFLVFIDAADRLLPRAVEIALEAFAAKPASGFVFGKSALVGLDHRQLGLDVPAAPSSEEGYLGLLEQRPLHLETVMFRRAAFEGGRRFDPTIPRSSDWDLLLMGTLEYPVYGHGHTVSEYLPERSRMSRDAALISASEMAVLRRHRKIARTLPGGREAHRAAVRRSKERARSNPAPTPGDDLRTGVELTARPPGPDRVVAGVHFHEPLPESLVGCHIDRPCAGQKTDHGRLDIAGWVLGKVRVASIQASANGKVLRVVPVEISRPDVAEAFPGVPGAETAGFHMRVDLAAIDVPAEVSMSAVLSDGETVPLGSLLVSPAR